MGLLRCPFSLPASSTDAPATVASVGQLLSIAVILDGSSPAFRLPGQVGSSGVKWGQIGSSRVK